MSMQTHIIRGYGLEIEKVPYGTRLQFCVNHMKNLAVDNKILEALGKITEEDLEALENAEFDEDVDEDVIDILTEAASALGLYEDENNLGGMIASIIARETGVIFGYEPGQSWECDGGESILVYEGLPWTFGGHFFKSEEEAFHALTPYQKELGTEEPGYLVVEYFG